MSDRPSTLLQAFSELVGDVAWGSTKELLRVLVTASVTTVLVSLGRRQAKDGDTRRWTSVVKLLGAVALLLAVLGFAADRAAFFCDTEEPLCGFVPGLKRPPPPPPPRLKQLQISTRETAKGITRYVREHPFQVAAGLGGLFLADLLNLAVDIDRLDIVVRLVKVVTSPLLRLAAAVQRLALRRRADTLVAAASAAGRGRGVVAWQRLWRAKRAAAWTA